MSLTRGRIDFNRRCWAFGCSLTAHYWPTVSDLIGANFAGYVNCGQPGASNRFIVDRFFEAEYLNNLDPARDHIIIQTTAWGRYAGYDQEKDCWIQRGDQFYYKNGPTRSWITDDRAFNPRLCLRHNWTALSSISQYLTARGYTWTLIPGFNFLELWDVRYGLKFTDQDRNRMLDLEQQLDLDSKINGPYLWDYCEDLRDPEISKSVKDQHPNPQECWQYIQQHLPEFTVQPQLVLPWVEKGMSSWPLHNPVVGPGSIQGLYHLWSEPISEKIKEK